MRRPSIFFCYAWKTEERYRQLDYLRSVIEKKGQSQVEVVLDRYSYEDNADFSMLRERIKKYDLVVVFCTPDLKKIISDMGANHNKNREVLKEYQIIKERYRKEPSSLFPVIFEGEKEESLLDIFRERNARVYKRFGITKNKKGHYYIPRWQKQEFRIFVEKIICAAIYNMKNRSEEYESAREAMDNLFYLTDITDIPKSCLVKSELYDFVLDQRIYFVAGRKGAGKSTFIHNIREIDNQYFEQRYKHMIPLSAEAFQHELAYMSLVYKHSKDESIITQYDILCLFWQLYFILHGIVTIRYGIETFDIRTANPYYEIFDSYTKKVKDRIGLKNEPIVSDSVPRAVFSAVVEMIDEHYQSALSSCRDGELLITSFSSKFCVQKILDNNFSNRATKDFLRALRSCKRKIFISLDGFDTHSEDFRKDTEAFISDDEEYRRRVKYEELFFRTLIEVVTKFKHNKYNDPVANTFGKYMDFCIVLPKDRYDQIVENDRDSFKRQFGSMSWTAYELLQLLTKRVEYLISKINHEDISEEKSSDTEDYFQRMEKALAFFPGLPKSVNMNVQGNIIQMSLFNYILRSSFWRPRDVISNLSALLSRIVHIGLDGEIILDSNVKLSQEEVKLAIKDNARKIINEEFIDEYKHVFRNLGAVLKNLQGLNEQIAVGEFCDLIKEIRFDALFSYDMNLIENKLLVLYQLGVIGLRFDKCVMNDMHYLHNICFVFNAGMEPFDEFINDKYRKDADTQIVFNPIFVRKLRLSFDNTNELIGNWSREYMERNHRNKSLIKPL